MADPFDWLDAALADLDRRALRRTLAERHGPQRGDRITIDGRTLVNFGSNDYLGLASDPQIAAAVRSILDEHGFGSGASPLVTGRTSLHAELERRLAQFEGTESALVFATGYAANVGTITAVVGPGDAIYSDELNHASIIDGCRLSGAAIHVYRHADVEQLEQLLAAKGSFRRRLIVTDALFSMGGDCAPLRELGNCARRHMAMLLVDEAHATGVLGQSGRGVGELLGVESDECIRVGTLSKALGGLGGFVAGSRRLIDWLVNRARPYVFSTAPPAALAAAAIAALDIVRREPERRGKLLNSAATLRAALVARGWIRPALATQIVPVVLGEAERALAAAAELRRRGFFVPAIRPPSVPAGQSLLRLSLTSRHTDQQLQDVVAALDQAIK